MTWRAAGGTRGLTWDSRNTTVDSGGWESAAPNVPVFVHGGGEGGINYDATQPAWVTGAACRADLNSVFDDVRYIKPAPGLAFATVWYAASCSPAHHVACRFGLQDGECW